MNAIKERFHDDIYQGRLARFEPEPICIEIFNFRVQYRALQHREFIQLTCADVVDESGELTLNQHLKQLDKLRKMLVNNKQQRKTAHKQNRRVALTIQSVIQNDVDHCEFELTNELLAQSVLRLKEMDVSSKQHHATVAHNIMADIKRICREIPKAIYAYQVAHENAVGKIIHHAEKCRAYHQKMLRLAVIQYCATRWFITYKDPTDTNQYVIMAGYKNENNVDVDNTTFELPDITEIQIYTTNGGLVYTFNYDDTDSNEMVTEESIEAFEWEQQSLWFDTAAAAAAVAAQ